jgi:hypothetical protein
MFVDRVEPEITDLIGRIYVKVGACQEHKRSLEHLRQLCKEKGDVITLDIIQEAVSFESEPSATN